MGATTANRNTKSSSNPPQGTGRLRGGGTRGAPARRANASAAMPTGTAPAAIHPPHLTIRVASVQNSPGTNDSSMIWWHRHSCLCNVVHRQECLCHPNKGSTREFLIQARELLDGMRGREMFPGPLPSGVAELPPQVRVVQ